MTTTCKDAEGNDITSDCLVVTEEETDDLAESTKIVYRFRLWKRIEGFSFNIAVALCDDDTPVFTFLLP